MLCFHQNVSAISLKKERETRGGGRGKQVVLEKARSKVTGDGS